jgi:hypothetical protein
MQRKQSIKVSKLITKIEKCVKFQKDKDLFELVKALKGLGGQNELLEIDYEYNGQSIKCTLLMNFVLQGEYDFVQLLLTDPNPSDVMIINSRGETALYLAIASAARNPCYDEKIIVELLQHNPNEQVVLPNVDHTPLYLCVKYCRLDLLGLSR